MTARAMRTQAKAEVVMTLRRGESLLVAIGIPVVLLGFFSSVAVLPTPTGTTERVDFLAPGVLALAVMSTGMVSLGIATAFERSYGVLKRLGATPLTRRDLLVAKTVGVLVVEALQVAVLCALAAALGWRPVGAGIAQALVAALLATAAFSGIGLLLAGTLRAEAVLALANGLYLVLLLLGGMVIPLASLPRPLELVARALPASALADALHAALGRGGGVPAGSWIVLALWALAAPAAAALTFRWE
jgi:ABC-2 type transport system permease protein